MAQVTNTTQIDTIDILTAATVVEGSDLLFLQRGSVSHKIKKSDMKWGIGNLSDVLDSGDPDSNLDTKLVTEKRIKDYIDNIPPSSPEWIDLTGATHNLGYTGVIDKTYNIADFTGVGLNTSRIRMLFIYIYRQGAHQTNRYMQHTPMGYCEILPGLRGSLGRMLGLWPRP